MSMDSDVRRRPMQARSRQRFDRIVSAGASLLGARGAATFTMTDVAEEAGMALTAVYRYFPNQHAVVRELALRTFELDAAWLGSDIDPEATVETIVAAGVEEYWRRHRVDSFRLPLRAAIRADPDLAELDLAESRRNAAMIAEVVVGLTGRTDVDVVEQQALLLVELVDSLMSVASRVDPDEAQAMVRQFVEMFAQRLAGPAAAPGR